MRVQLMIRGERSLHLCCIGQRRVRSDIYLTEAQTQPWPNEASLPASLSNILFPLLTWIFFIVLFLLISVVHVCLQPVILHANDRVFN